MTASTGLQAIAVLRLMRCKQGHKIQLELWKVLQEDPRWLGQAGALDPANFNPDRLACYVLQSHVLDCFMLLA